MTDEILPNICDVDNYHKNLEKIKNTTKLLNEYIILQRERTLYFEEKQYFPEEFDWPEWKQGIERSRYVKKLTEENETSTAKRPRPQNIKPAKNPKPKLPWTPPKH